MPNQNSLPVKMKLGYGVGELGSVLFWSALAFLLLNFLTDEVGLSAGLAGVAIMLGKIWDAVTDPTVGFLSDRTRTRWGRRRPWFLFGSVPLGLAFFLMFTNPGLKEQTEIFIWASLAYILLCTAYTVVNIPYISMVPEMTSDFDEKTSINAYRSVFSITGTLIGAGSAIPIITLFDDRHTGFMVMGAIFGLIITISAIIPFFAVKEPVNPPIDKDTNIFKTNIEALKNKAYLAVLFPFALNTAGITVITATLIYYFKYIFNNEQMLTFALVIMLLGSMIFIPIALLVSKKIGKKNTYIIGMTVIVISLFLLFFIGHLYDVYVIYLIMAVMGIGVSTHYVMPWSMLPDVVEYDYSINGVRREGVFYGIWTFATKVGAAFAGLTGGAILSYFGYIANQPQTASSLLGIRLLIGPITAVFFIISILIIYFYPIDNRRYNDIQEKIRLMEETKTI